MQVEQFNVKDVGKPFKKAGGAIADTSKKAGGAIADTSKKAGGAIVDTSKKAGGAVAGGVKKGAGAVGNAAKKVGGFLGGILGKIWGFLKAIFKNWKSVLSVVCCVCFLSIAGPFIGPLLGMGRAASSLFGRSRVRYNN
jgi:phage-related tail protein